MKINLLGAVLAFLIGVGISAINFAISKYFVKHKPEHFAAVQLVRQPIQIAYLLLIYFFAAYTPFDRLWLLVGGALGITVPMLFFTVKLVKLNDSVNKKEDL